MFGYDIVTSLRLARRVAIERRIWFATAFLFGWPALGVLTGWDLLRETAIPLVYVYLVLVRAVVRVFPGDATFWVGYAVFTFCVATVSVVVYDYVRFRLERTEQTERFEPLEG